MSPVTEDPLPTPSFFTWLGIRTSLNAFGLFREYPSIPTHNPDDSLSLSDLTNTPLPASFDSSVPSKAPYGPFTNSTAFGLMNWMWTGSGLKSVGEIGRLVAFLKSDDFRKDDLKSFDVKKETQRLDRSLESNEANPLVVRDGWNEVSVDIRVPDGKRHALESENPLFSVPGLHFRSLIEVIREAVHDSSSKTFHFTPFKQYFQRTPESPPQRVLDELYSSDSFIEEHAKVQQQPAEPDCHLERVVLGLMFWSDSTHLASFGTASLWPLYLFFGNQSKWLRGKPRSGCCHHVAYIPKVCRIWCGVSKQ
jgi:Plavaka transposase